MKRNTAASQKGEKNDQTSEKDRRRRGTTQTQSGEFNGNFISFNEREKKRMCEERAVV